jgi:hypothetical protein
MLSPYDAGLVSLMRGMDKSRCQQPGNSSALDDVKDMHLNCLSAVGCGSFSEAVLLHAVSISTSTSSASNSAPQLIELSCCAAECASMQLIDSSESSQPLVFLWPGLADHPTLQLQQSSSRAHHCISYSHIPQWASPCPMES